MIKLKSGLGTVVFGLVGNCTETSIFLMAIDGQFRNVYMIYKQDDGFIYTCNFGFVQPKTTDLHLFLWKTSNGDKTIVLKVASTVADQIRVYLSDGAISIFVRFA